MHPLVQQIHQLIARAREAGVEGTNREVVLHLAEEPPEGLGGFVATALGGGFDSKLPEGFWDEGGSDDSDG